MSAPPTYPDVLRELFRREAAKTSVRQLARDLGIARSGLNAALLGERGREVRPSYLDALAAHRGVSLSTIAFDVARLAVEMEVRSEAASRGKGK